MKLLPIISCMTLMTSCIDSTLNEVRSVQCTMTFSDNCLATLSSGKSVWMKAFSSAETVVSYSDAEKECNDAAAAYQHSGPHLFYFEGGKITAKDAQQADGDYLIKGQDNIEFLYVKIGQAEFRLGEEIGSMTCTTKTHGGPHSY